MVDEKDFNEAQWLYELCTSNGHDQKKSDLKQVDSLELFLSSIPKLPRLEIFDNLSTLRIVGCAIEKIEHLGCLTNLIELWLCDGKIKQIENLDHNVDLELLYLYGNEIKKIENLSHLTSLTSLWLNANKIEDIENLEELKLLKTLNLSNNKIRQIESSIKKNYSLEDLNLSGNLISSLKDIPHLSLLPRLTSLGLKDPMSAPNPVASLCNYSTYVLYHIPTLTRLDSFDVSPKSLKDFAESTVLKKQIFYKMRVKTLERMNVSLKTKLKDEMENLQEISHSSLWKLINATKEIEREIDNLVCGTKKTIIDDDSNSDTFDDIASNRLKELYTAKLKSIKERIAFWEMEYENLYSLFKELYNQASWWKNNYVKQLQIEFASGGNVRFEEGNNADVWYNSCHDLIQARFSAQEYKDFKVSGIKVHKIIRVQNRLLKMKFDQKYDGVTSNDDPTSTYKDSHGRRIMDYLFLVNDPKLPLEVSDIFRILEEGLAQPNQYQTHGGHAAVPLSNSIQISDKRRIKTMSHGKNCAFRFGQILICKTYLGKSTVASSDKRIMKSNYPNFDSVYHTKKHPISTCPNKLKKNHLNTPELCECTLRRCSWHVFDPNMVLPEYIVDFEYLMASTSPLTAFFSALSSMKSENSYNHSSEINAKKDDHECSVDEKLLNSEPAIPSRPRLTVLTEDGLLNQCGQSHLSQIAELNLHGSGLSKVKLLTLLPSLKKLILSFNELTSMNDLGGMNSLEYLDVSFNQIVALDGFKLSPNLSYLDISWNCFYYTREEVSLMRKYMPALKILKVAHNAWMKGDSLRLRCIGRLRMLSVMDDKVVTEEETNIAVRLAALSRIAYITVLANSRTDVERIRSLNLGSSTENLMTLSLNKPVKLGEDDKQWFSKVTALHLDNQHLSKISNLEKLEHLKWASFNNNDITKVEGLEHTKELVELSLSGNCISRIEGLNHLINLQHLDISNNNLSNLDGLNFEKLSKLNYLAFDSNYVTTLSSLKKATSLLEIYAGNNQISQLREIFYLKNISSLLILDCIGNPFADESNHYRLFLIYHLQNIKALDGIPVDCDEGGMAKDTFGGKLSTDFIAEKLGHSNFLELCELDLPNCNLRAVELNRTDMFNNLKSLNLEHNNLTSFGGIINLVNLKVLCLNYNHIESILPKKAGVSSPTGSRVDVEALPTLLHKLEVLHLAYNGITNLPTLQLGRLSMLKALFLQGNEIIKVEGFEGLNELKELVLDRNKIKCFQENSFCSLWKLVELHVEENRLRDLSYIEDLKSLRRLYIGLNRIQDTVELEKLQCLAALFELSVIGNPFARRVTHRSMLIFRQPNLLMIDGIPITNDERAKAEIYYIEQQGGFQALQAMNNSFDPSFPGLVSTLKPPLKVSHVPSNVNVGRYWNPTSQISNMHIIDYRETEKSNKPKNSKRHDLSFSRSNQYVSSNSNKNAYDNKYKHR